MADILATVRARLLSVSGVTALVSTRVYTRLLPQSPVLPAVLVQRVSEVQRAHLRGGETMKRTRVQVTSVAASAESATAVDAAIEGDNAGSSLSHWFGTVGSPSAEIRAVEPAGVEELYEPGELRQFRIARDFMVEHR